MAVEEVLAEVDRLAGPWTHAVAGQRLPLVELTGGEPLLQKGSLALMESLCNAGYTVLLETSGAIDIGPVDPRVHRIMDIKCPSSGEADQNRWENIPLLRATDEVKFVMGTREDFDWARHVLEQHKLPARCPILFSWVAPLTATQQHSSLKPVPAGHTPLTRQQLAELVINEALPVRFQVQMHKVIWSPDARGV
jgi:7-carboxy-7-deazaguanine synthase